MNPTLEPYVKKLLDGGMKTAEDVASFIEKQTPELGREIITWGAISESIAPIVGLCMVFAALMFHIKHHKKEWYYSLGQYYNYPPAVFVPFFIAFIGLFIFFTEISDAIYPLVAPRLYILEKISRLIK
jgi:H+/Cl- antiporter ClcA